MMAFFNVSAPLGLESTVFKTPVFGALGGSGGEGPSGFQNDLFLSQGTYFCGTHTHMCGVKPETQGRLAGIKHVVLDHINVVENHTYVVRNHIYVVSNRTRRRPVG